MTAAIYAVGRALRDQAGNAAVEFALLTPILLLLVAGTVDLGLGFQQKLELQSALNSGLQHVIQTQGADLAKSRDVIRLSLDPNISAGIETSSICKCRNVVSVCSSSCPSGLAHYAGASISRSYHSPVFQSETVLAASFELYIGGNK